jgi:hypothetical protein
MSRISTNFPPYQVYDEAVKLHDGAITPQHFNCFVWRAGGGFYGDVVSTRSNNHIRRCRERMRREEKAADAKERSRNRKRGRGERDSPSAQRQLNQSSPSSSKERHSLPTSNSPSASQGSVGGAPITEPKVYSSVVPSTKSLLASPASTGDRPSRAPLTSDKPTITTKSKSGKKGSKQSPSTPTWLHDKEEYKALVAEAEHVSLNTCVVRMMWEVEGKKKQSEFACGYVKCGLELQTDFGTRPKGKLEPGHVLVEGFTKRCPDANMDDAFGTEGEGCNVVVSTDGRTCYYSMREVDAALSELECEGLYMHESILYRKNK